MEYPSIKQIETDHCTGMQTVFDFLRNHGAILYHKTYSLSRGLRIEIHHDNEYVEIGPHTPDPSDVLYWIYTQETIEFRVPFDGLQHMMRSLKNNQYLGEHRIADNVCIATNVTNQYVMDGRIRMCDYTFDLITLRIDFKVFHFIPKYI